MAAHLSASGTAEPDPPAVRDLQLQFPSPGDIAYRDQHAIFLFAQRPSVTTGKTRHAIALKYQPRPTCASPGKPTQGMHIRGPYNLSRMYDRRTHRLYLNAGVCRAVTATPLEENR